MPSTKFRIPTLEELQKSEKEREKELIDWEKKQALAVGEEKKRDREQERLQEQEEQELLSERKTVLRTLHDLRDRINDLVREVMEDFEKTVKPYDLKIRERTHSFDKKMTWNSRNLVISLESSQEVDRSYRFFLVVSPAKERSDSEDHLLYEQIVAIANILSELTSLQVNSWTPDKLTRGQERIRQEQAKEQAWAALNPHEREVLIRKEQFEDEARSAYGQS